MALSDYLLDTKALLRDSNSLFYPEAQLIRWINRARYQIALKTGCIRILVSGIAPYGNTMVPGVFIPGAGQPGSSDTTFQTIVGVEKYPYGYANPYVKEKNAGVKGVIDVIDVAVSWGGIRPVLNWMPWEDLQAYARSYNVRVTSYPFLWSTNGDGENGEVWLFPVPNTAIDMQWDCTCVPKEIYSNDDPDAVPDPFREYVPFYACFLALSSAQRFDAAQIHAAYLEEHLGIARVASDRGKTPSFYYRIP